MRKFLSEPFVHFVILGGLLFAGHSIWQKQMNRADKTIRVSPSEMARQAQNFATENGREPTDDDLEGLLFAHIEDEILMREAQRLGLDSDDTIIRRRLAQKMRHMIDDISVPILPPRTELKTWFEANSAKFRRPETRSFEHIYLSPKGRTNTVVAEADAMLTSGVPEAWSSQGDSFKLGRTFETIAAPAVERDFGTRFSSALFALPNDADWQGPLNSAFGVHLVRLTEVSPEALPEFESILSEVEAVWIQTAKDEDQAKALKTLLSKYKVEIEE